MGITSTYQPALDGFRAIAILLVMSYHVGLDGGTGWIGGGWLGVDLFFAISGYLITSLLLNERARTASIGLRRFYARRLLRLAPLSIAVVAVCWVIVTVVPSTMATLRLTDGGAVSILAYCSNWWSLWHPGSVGELAHAWSLSIEEQFYFVWPTVVVGVFAVARRAARGVLIGLGALAVVAMWVARRRLWLDALVDPSRDAQSLNDAWQRFYLSSFLRPDALVLGCLLALVLHDVTRTVAVRTATWVVGIAGTFGIAAMLARYSYAPWIPTIQDAPSWGLALFNVCAVGALAWLVVAPGSPMGRILSWSPMCWIGRRAYGIYFLHPVILVVLVRHTHLHGMSLTVAFTVVTFAVSAAVFRWFETPFLRRKERFASDRGRVAVPTRATD